MVDEKPIDTDSDLPMCELDPYAPNEVNNSNDQSQHIRDVFREYFNGIGSVDWQNRILGFPDCNFSISLTFYYGRLE